MVYSHLKMIIIMRYISFLGFIEGEHNFWIVFLGIRVLLFLGLVELFKLMDSQHKVRKGICLLLVIAFLLLPNTIVIKDGGSKMYWAPLYEIIVWNQMDNYDDNNNTVIPGRHDTEVFIFPYNTNWFED